MNLLGFAHVLFKQNLPELKPKPGFSYFKTFAKFLKTQMAKSGRNGVIFKRKT